ncbi:hypothetical protein [Leucobacter sp. M11]|uniref:hypothetical protein n=1 Tax=Leucobacter sp. M11 TaxID=2993565 RepID=UPI002D7FB262|nr:hypothetical protein [Leucobacter sp. M11]MEB4613136.1 hypothetical protein [Leucobacter sp. M11]
MLSVLRSEFTKMLTVPGTWLVTAVIVLLFGYVQQGAYVDHLGMLESVQQDGTATTDLGIVQAAPEIRGSIGITIINSSLILPVLGAVMAGTEFRAGQLGLSLVSVPNRTRFVLGKVLAIALYAAGLAIVFIATALVLIFLAIKDWDTDLLWDSSMLGEIGRAIFVVVTTTLIGATITLIARRTLTGIIVSISLLTLTFAQIIAMISPVADALLPWSASRNLLFQDAAFLPVPVTGTDVQGALVLSAWAVAGVIVAAVLIRRRDAR